MAGNPREIGWSDSSDSDEGIDIEEAHDAGLAENPREPPGHRAARVLVVEFNHQFIDMNRAYWNCSLVAVLIDRRQFSVRRLQAIINTFWRLQGLVTVVGRDDNRYVLHFARLDDLIFIYTNAPWSVQGGFLVTILWEPNMILRNLIVREAPVWVEFWGLPLEFQIPWVARKLASLVGQFLETDWTPQTPRNIRFLRAKVRVRLDDPLLMGAMISLDSGAFIWVTIRYERIYKLCRNYGLIGHSYPHCPWTDEEIIDALNEQLERLQRTPGTEMGMSFTRTHFVSEARRFLNNRERRSTMIRTVNSPSGSSYRPLSPPPIDYDLDPMGYIDEQGEMQGVSPTTEQLMDEQAGLPIKTDFDDELLEPDLPNVQGLNLGHNNLIPEQAPIFDPPTIPAQPLNIAPPTTSYHEMLPPKYHYPAIYPNETEDPKLLAPSWNITDRRPPYISIFPLPILFPSPELQQEFNSEQTLSLIPFDNDQIGISNGRWMEVYVDAPKSYHNDRFIAFPASLNDIPPGYVPSTQTHHNLYIGESRNSQPQEPDHQHMPEM